MVEEPNPASCRDNNITYSIWTKKDGKEVGVGGFRRICDGWPELWYTITVKRKGYATEFAKAATRKWFRKSMEPCEVVVGGHTLTQRERDESLAGKKRKVKPRIYVCVQLGDECPEARAEKEASVKVLKKAGFELVDTWGTIQHFVLIG
jgi:hypothetical protein